MKKYSFLLIILLVLSNPFLLKGDEGMWLLPYLQKLNYEDMRAMGLNLTPDQIYNPDSHSLKDAIVVFDGNSTGGIISPEGLLLGGSVRSLKITDESFLNEGFWAIEREQELPVEGLVVTFVRKIEDVTDAVLDKVKTTMDESERSGIVEMNVEKLIAKLQRNNKGKRILIESFFEGNSYFAFVLEDYEDVRLVGAPPSSKAGFENRVWPCYSGDFSLFRIYTDQKGRPAQYSPENIPYQSPVHFRISLEGYKENGFAMVMGFPKFTERYITTHEIDDTLNLIYPIREFIYNHRKSILKEYMDADEQICLRYAEVYEQLTDYLDNNNELRKAVVNNGIRENRYSCEESFMNRALSDSNFGMYERAIPMIYEGLYESDQVRLCINIIEEALLRSLGIVRVLDDILFYYDDYADGRLNVEELLDIVYQNYDEALEKSLTRRMLEIVINNLPKEFQPSFIEEFIDGQCNGNPDLYVEFLFGNSVISNRQKAKEFLEHSKFELLYDDVSCPVLDSSLEICTMLKTAIGYSSDKLLAGKRLYMDGLQRMMAEDSFYPDANFTVRLTYGTVLPYKYAVDNNINYYTTLSDMIEREDFNSFDNLYFKNRLRKLSYTKDYGLYAACEGNYVLGEMFVNFLTTNDITDGNQGSPVLNGNGELIGVVFNNNSDVAGDVFTYDVNRRRCINVDVRYVLFVIDKFAGAGHLLDEMTIVNK